jgi:hypothetical protein
LRVEISKSNVNRNLYKVYTVRVFEIFWEVLNFEISSKLVTVYNPHRCYTLNTGPVARLEDATFGDLHPLAQRCLMNYCTAHQYILEEMRDFEQREEDAELAYFWKPYHGSTLLPGGKGGKDGKGDSDGATGSPKGSHSPVFAQLSQPGSTATSPTTTGPIDNAPDGVILKNTLQDLNPIELHLHRKLIGHEPGNDEVGHDTGLICNNWILCT